jgi:hypothetical protein
MTAGRLAMLNSDRIRNRFGKISVLHKNLYVILNIHFYGTKMIKVKRVHLSLILIGIFALFMFAVFFSNTLSTTSYRTEQTAVQTKGMKGSFDAEREHGYCSDSHPIRGAHTCPVNGMPTGRP